MKMMIFYFSGTGNTEVVTKKLTESLIEKGNSVDCIKIEDLLFGEHSLKDLISEGTDEINYIGIGFPIYGFNPPRVVFEFLKKVLAPMLKELRNIPEFFIYSTCAGPVYLNDIAHFKLKRSIQSVGGKIIYERQFYMPANLFYAYPEDVNVMLVDSSMKKAEKMAAELTDGWKLVRNDKVLPYMFGWIYGLEHFGWKYVNRFFKITKECTSCGKCESLCPAKNINLVEGMPIFGKNCYVCLRCIYGCPEKAIGFGRYNFAIFKEGYSIKDFLDKEPPKDLSALQKGYLKTLKKYVTEI